MATYGICHKIHVDLGGKADGCQEFMASEDAATLECAACGCHRNFHRKATAKYVKKVVYLKCNKIHGMQGGNTVDGCQEFTAKDERDGDPRHCAVCGCHKVFHRKEIAVEEGASHPADG